MKIIITGSTGMVGKAVLLECIEHNSIHEILVINRSELEMKHAKVKEVILADFSDFSVIQDNLSECDACFHCMGVSSVGMAEEKFGQLTFDVTKSLVDVLFELNPSIIFNYVSGKGTDSTENGKTMWARVKGKTENYIFKKGFKDAYAFRPGIILPEKGVKSKTGWYNGMYVVTRPLFPLFKRFRSVTTSSKIGLAMIKTLLFPTELKKLENEDINDLAKQV